MYTLLLAAYTTWLQYAKGGGIYTFLFVKICDSTGGRVRLEHS